MPVSGAHTVERLNRTIKEHIQTRLDAMGLDRDKWVSQLAPIINKYNNTEQRTIHMTPNEARKPSSSTDVSFHLWNNSKHDRKYPVLHVGDPVRVLMKKQTHTKGYHPKWSPVLFRVQYIKGHDYLINDGKRKVYIRHELLKIDG